VNLGDLGEFTRVLGCRHNAPEFSGSRSLVAMYGLLLGRVYPLAISLALGLEVDQAIGFFGKLLGLAGEQIVFGGIQKRLDGRVGETYVVRFNLGCLGFGNFIRVSHDQRRWLDADILLFLLRHFRLSLYNIYYFVRVVGFKF